MIFGIISTSIVFLAPSYWCMLLPLNSKRPLPGPVRFMAYKPEGLAHLPLEDQTDLGLGLGLGLWATGAGATCFNITGCNCPVHDASVSDISDVQHMALILALCLGQGISDQSLQLLKLGACESVAHNSHIGNHARLLRCLMRKQATQC